MPIRAVSVDVVRPEESKAAYAAVGVSGMRHLEGDQFLCDGRLIGTSHPTARPAAQRNPICQAGQSRIAMSMSLGRRHECDKRRDEAKRQYEERDRYDQEPQPRLPRHDWESHPDPSIT